MVTVQVGARGVAVGFMRPLVDAVSEWEPHAGVPAAQWQVTDVVREPAHTTLLTLASSCL